MIKVKANRLWATSCLDPLEPRRLLSVADGPLPMAIADTGFLVDTVRADTMRNRVYVGDRTNHAIHVFDTDVGKQIAVIPLLDAPDGIAETPDGTGLLVTLGGTAKVQLLSLTSLTVARTIDVDQPLGSPAVGAGNVFYVQKYLSDDPDPDVHAALVQYDLGTGAVRATITRHEDYIEFAVSADGKHLDVASDRSDPTNVEDFDISTPTAVRSVAKYQGVDFYASSVDHAAGRIYSGDAGGLAVTPIAGSAKRAVWSGDDTTLGTAFASSPAAGSYVVALATWSAQVGYGGEGIGVFDPATRKQLWHYQPTRGHPLADTLAVTPNGHVMYACHDDFGENADDWSLGLIGTSTLSLPGSDGTVLAGTVFKDLNLNGKRDKTSEHLGLDALVYLDLNGNGLLDESPEPYVGVQDDGRFSLEFFNPVASGTYALRLAADPFNGGHFAPLLPSKASSVRVSVAAGTQQGDLVLGAAYAAVVNVTTYGDANANATLDDGESSFEAAVFLDANDNGVLDAGEPAHTAAQTGEPFAVKPGAYTVRFVDAGRYAAPAGAPAASAPPRLTVASDVATDVDLGAWPLRTFGGTLFDDADRDGQRDADEPALANVRVWLDLDGDNRVDDNEPTATSAADGTFAVRPDAPVDNASIRFANADGVKLRSTAHRSRVTLATPGDAIAGAFGLYAPTTLSITAYLDLDRNRKHSKGDRWLAYTIAYLDLDGDGRQDKNEPSAITDGVGHATFDDLAAGAYVVRLRASSKLGNTTGTTLNVTLATGAQATLVAPVRVG